jgi:hypothetical protein
VAAATLLQLTAPICAQCPQARALLGELAATIPGAQHTELDLAEYPGLAGLLRVRSTPATLTLTPPGRCDVVRAAASLDPPASV